MNSLSNLRRPRASWHRKKRVGRGQGSGLGKTAGRGGKGQKARTGNMRFEGFEGGQSPLQRRLPKFGFNSPNRKEFAVVNVGELEGFDAGADGRRGRAPQGGPGEGPLDRREAARRGHAQPQGGHARAPGHGEGQGGGREGGRLGQLVPLMAHKPEAAAKAHAGKGAKA